MESSNPKPKKQWDVERRHPRIRADLNATVSFPGTNEAPVKYALCTNLGIGGLSVYLQKDLATGSEVEVELTLPGADHISRFRAVVRNKTLYRYGLEWSGLREDQLLEVREACERIAGETSAP